MAIFYERTETKEEVTIKYKKILFFVRVGAVVIGAFAIFTLLTTGKFGEPIGYWILLFELCILSLATPVLTILLIVMLVDFKSIRKEITRARKTNGIIIRGFLWSTDNPRIITFKK